MWTEDGAEVSNEKVFWFWAVIIAFFLLLGAIDGSGDNRPDDVSCYNHPTDGYTCE